MSDAGDKVVVKKVQPYPILAKFDDQNGKVFAGNIVKLTLVGFLVELNEVVINVQQKFSVSFEFPVLEKAIETSVHVVKTYDQFRDPTVPPVNPDGTPAPESVAVRLAELHFLQAESHDRDKIKQFLVAIGQAPR